MDSNIVLCIAGNSILLVAAAAMLSHLHSEKNKKKRPPPRFHVHPYLIDRDTCGRFATDFEDLTQHPNLFADNFRMSPETFERLFRILEPLLMPKKNSRRDAIHPKQKLAVVLEYLASGDLQRHLASCYRISKQHLCKIIDHVCDAICVSLRSEIPTWNKDMLREIAKEFKEKWNFPNVIGAIDGKHVQLRMPPKSGSMFYNYKGYHSIVLLAVCDASYRFTYIDVGAYGSEGDANIFTQSNFGRQLLSDSLDFPENNEVNGKQIPYFLLGDDAFPLSKRIMKPFSPKTASNEEKIFNYRLSRARRCIENAFGILSSKWICLQRSMYCYPDKAQKIVSACCLLHNFLMRTDSEVYQHAQEVREQNAATQMAGLSAYLGRSSDFAKQVRNELKIYFNSTEGSLPWQNKAAFV